MKRILLPTDFSTNARLSMNYASQLFAEEDVEFIIIHTYDPTPTPAQVTSKKLSETIVADSESDLENEKSFLAGKINNPNTKITSLSRKGALSQVLNNTGKKHKADLIIMSPRGAGQNIDFGSNTIAVMKSSDIPVLVVPENKEFHPYKKVLFAADLQGYSRESLDYPLNYFMAEFNSSVEVVHFGSGESDIKKQIMDDLVERFGKDRTHVQYIQVESVIEGLQNTMRNQQPDLLVLVNRHRRFFSRLFLKSVTNNMVIDAPVPILILHDKT